MSSKRDLHTLFIKHDTDFVTLSKKALSELILKIVFLQEGGTKINHIKDQLSKVITGNIPDQLIDESLRILERDGKLTSKRSKYSIHPKFLPKLQKSATENTAIQDRVFAKYLTGGQTSLSVLKTWFQDTLILFFENFSMEWFHHVSQNGKLSPKKIDQNVSTAVDNSILQYGAKIVEADKEWLKSNFIKFYESEEYDENMVFWNFGMSLFSSRLITARHYADKISIEAYKNGTFLLDTNILMILDLEGHEFGKSFESLDNILDQLNIKTKYLHITSEEYKRAILGRKTDTISVFESFDIQVLETTKCPFVQTALKRGCTTQEDVAQMFDQLYDLPEFISQKTKVEKIDYLELENEVEKGKSDEALKTKINEIHLKRLKRDKRENPKVHDAGMIYGVNFLRQSSPTWILTTDGTLKMYAIENIVRNESEIAVGLDVLIGMFAVNNGGVNVNSSDFAPLFKNLVKNSLIPEEHLFDVRDLAFILSTNLRINDLERDKVVEIANEVRRMRIAGKEDDEVSLFLRREIEGQKLTIVNELGRAKASEGMARSAKDRAERERDSAFDALRQRRRGELRTKYDRDLFINRFGLVGIPLIVSICVFLVLRYGLGQDPVVQYVSGCSVELIFGIIPYYPLNKRIVKKHSEYVSDINAQVEREILELKNSSKE